MQPAEKTRPISTNRNGSYGGPEAPVTQKYRPLEGITLDRRADQPLCTGLLGFRHKLITDAGLLPAPLQLMAQDWDSLIAAEKQKNRLPPLIVVSTNRSNWIREGIDAADRQLRKLGIERFDNVSDLRALTAAAGQTVSPPIYCPARLGTNPNRRVCVLVHMSEYPTYKATLEGTGITPIGWAFKSLPGAPHRLVGFGASRYAAIEFCKYLCGLNAAAWHAAWLFDDNVVALTSFAGLDKTEAALAKNPQFACAGFHGGSKVEIFTANRDWAQKEIAAKRGGAPANLPDSKAPGILQQAVLWNMDYFIKNESNFGVVFVTSAEDISLGNYFDTHKVSYLYYQGIGVRKEEATPDGAKDINDYRQELQQWMTTAEAKEKAGTGASPPPPTLVQSTNPGDKADGVQLLSTFVVKRVLPHSGLAAEQADPATQQTAQSRAVEQITSQAIAEKIVDEGMVTQTFAVNGGKQVIERHPG